MVNKKVLLKHLDFYRKTLHSITLFFNGKTFIGKLPLRGARVLVGAFE